MPVSVPLTSSRSVPPVTLRVPVLLKPLSTVTTPVPGVFQLIVPALLTVFVPAPVESISVTGLPPAPALVTLKVPPSALLEVEPPLIDICPAASVAAPLFTRSRPASSCFGPAADKVEVPVVVNVPPSVTAPPDQLNAPFTVTDPVPPSVPPLKLSAVATVVGLFSDTCALAGPMFRVPALNALT